MPVSRYDTIQPGEPVLELLDVTRRFIKRRERSRSFQDRFLRLLSRRNVEQEEFWPLDGVSLTLARGECLGIIGPNGSGKSTLLKLVSGILPPTAGEMIVRGRVCSLLELGAGFHPDLTGRENIYLNGSIYGLSRAQMNERIDRIIDYAELGDFIDTPVRHYSSGMYVRLGFAVAIHTDPDLLLVDEVLAVGDTTFQHKCLTSIRQLQAAGVTMILVSHDLASIQSICSRAIWIRHGKVQSDGPPLDVTLDYLSQLSAEEDAARAHGPGEITDVEKLERRRWGSGKIRITRVETLDEDGNPVPSLQTGGPLTVRLHYQAPERIEQPVFGIGLHSQGGVHVGGPNTRTGQFRIPFVEGEGTLSYHMPAVPLIEGEYLLSVAVVNTDDTETFDYHDRLYPVRVHAGRSGERYGLVKLAGEWSLAPESPPAVPVEPAPVTANGR